jgi:hypothetical protein
MPDSKTHLNSATVVRKKAGNHGAEMENGYVLLNVIKGEYVNFNEVGASIWRSIGEENSIGNICDTICEEFEISKSKCEVEVIKFIRILIRENLISIK